MKIRKLKLFTHRLDVQRKFYFETLGLDVVGDHSNRFTVRIGWTELTFEHSKQEHYYHYCFLLPENKLHEALQWMENRVAVLPIENGIKTQHFESWDADSFYFYDESGNLAECIVRHQMNNQSTESFRVSDLLCVNEIGMPTSNIEQTNKTLENQFGVQPWKGDTKRFGTSGNQEGLFLLPNYNEKVHWFPTQLKVNPEPFEVYFEAQGFSFGMRYENELIFNI
ncbi:MAG: hypothetical protein P1U56_21075 [Saprospiraceae bacterium]|nr:hypothetical protein [Saprospiraceae bacterium]